MSGRNEFTATVRACGRDMPIVGESRQYTVRHGDCSEIQEEGLT